MTTTDQMEIRVSPDEAAGLAEFIEHRWYTRQEELTGFISAETRWRLDEMVASLALHEALSDVGQESSEGGE